MKYFIDTEFIERFHKPLFGKARYVIDLISIGIVCEDGRTYQAISNEYRYKDANNWVKENVINPLYVDTVHGDSRNSWNADNFQFYYGRFNKQIAGEIVKFVYKPLLDAGIYTTDNIDSESLIQFYGYYSDYDWVVFCSLFGTMMDLPKGFPMYCKDLKQTLDELQPATIYDSPYGVTDLKNHPKYPKQTNEHNALADAKWNYELYKFLQRL